MCMYKKGEFIGRYRGIGCSTLGNKSAPEPHYNTPPWSQNGHTQTQNIHMFQFLAGQAPWNMPFCQQISTAFLRSSLWAPSHTHTHRLFWSGFLASVHHLSSSAHAAPPGCGRTLDWWNLCCISAKPIVQAVLECQSDISTSPAAVKSVRSISPPSETLLQCLCASHAGATCVIVDCRDPPCCGIWAVGEKNEALSRIESCWRNWQRSLLPFPVKVTFRIFFFWLKCSC